jgi:hypothetical protein
VKKQPLIFPPLTMAADDRVDWPKPPFKWRHAIPLANAVHPCRFETTSGAMIEGELVGMDLAAGELTFRSRPGASATRIPFTSFRRLTLTEPLKAEPLRGAPVERIPAAAQERGYRLQWTSAALPEAIGRTAGYVERSEGLFLFPPLEDRLSVLRVLIPRAAYLACTFGASAEEIAASRWVSDPAELLTAIERQEHKPVLPIGQSLLELGAITQAQLDEALAEKSTEELPLGERLVARGVISRGTLETALAHKMGYPVVNLGAFPIDPVAARRLPFRIALGARALPLMIDGTRLIVAVDRPGRMSKLQSLRAAAGTTFVAVLAPKSNLLAALHKLYEKDLWRENVSLTFFPTTN